MDFLLDLLLFVHLVGMGALFGGLFVQTRANPRVVNTAMFHGILTQLVSGIALVGVLEAGDEAVDHVKIAVKLVVALIIGTLILVNRKKEALTGGMYGALLGLTVVEIGVAVFWP